MTYARNLGALTEPEQQGYDLVMNRHVGLDGDSPYDPFRDGTRIYACPECGATWNADDLHDAECRRRGLRSADTQ